ncbi:Glycosyltransferase, GT2 family [Treponema bryantii]|uniref:Glycosyltransferase, GT2 family n=1 Tax=Treponema bryantii TaxID=163 RepID=A0A1H9FUS7_9SPIR|nr:glycosyltransferase [Treponema bryantii]SEQ41634.1 Glycosyltransferase, GT2 family [Treponema bryantii]
MKSKLSNKNVSFSFVIPCYERHELLTNTLNSIAKQKDVDFADIEVILIDDGSSVFYDVRLLEIPFEIKYVYLKRTKSSCRSKARNQGIKLAKNDVIVFIDSDVIIPEMYLFNLKKYFLACKNSVVIGTRLLLNDTISIKELDIDTIKSNSDFFEFRHKVLARYSFNSNCIRFPWLLSFTCNLAVSRNALIKTGGFDEGFKNWGIEDTEISYRLYKNGVKFYIAHDTEVIHQYHKSDSINSDEYIKANFTYFCKLHPEVIKKINRDDLLGMFLAKVSVHKALNNLKNKKERNLELNENTKKIKIFLYVILCILQNKKLNVYDKTVNGDFSIFVQNFPLFNIYYYPVEVRPYLQMYKFEYHC